MRRLEVNTGVSKDYIIMVLLKYRDLTVKIEQQIALNSGFYMSFNVGQCV